MILLRKARREDLDQLVELWKECAAEEVDGKYTYPGETPVAMLENYLAPKIDSSLDLVLVVEENKKIQGILVSSVGARAIGMPQLYIIGELFYIKPDKRGGTLAHRMLRKWKSWVKDLNLPINDVELLAAANPKQIGLWKKRDWKAYGVLMHKPIEEVV